MSDTNQAISTTVVDAIKHHHREAMGHATQAIDHAKQAGELLLKAKAVGADPILTHPADPILTRGWTLAA